MAGALDDALDALAPSAVALDPAPEPLRVAVVAWAAARGHVAVARADDPPTAGTLLVTADADRATAAIAAGAAALCAGTAAVPAPEGWRVHELPGARLVRPGPVASAPPTHGEPRADVSIVVPVHDAGAELRRCLRALARNTTWPAELVLVDDASHDPEVLVALAEVAERPNVRILRNTVNLGFAATVNRGLRAATGDVVLLNSDTEVGPRWLERLRDAVLRDPRTGTATAVSDNAGAFSVPRIGERNPVPAQLAGDAAARLVAQAVGDRRAPTPTANGFCMYLRRAMLDDVGPLDAEAFPRGYGEENDLCLRASRRGWGHVVDVGTYVRHVREASFRTEKAALARAGRALLDTRFPEYAEAVRAFAADPVMADARQRVAGAFAAATPPLPRVLTVMHEGGGGTPVGVLELLRELAGRFDCLLLTSDRRRLRLDRLNGDECATVESWDLDQPIGVLDFTREDYRAIATGVLREHAIDLVHVRHLFKHTFDLPVVAARLGLPVVVSFHDFYLTCPTVHLLDDTGSYCAGRCTPGDGACHVPPAGLDGLPHLKHAFVHQWREEVSAMLAGVDAFVTTSEHARGVHRRALPALGDRPFSVIPHGRSLAQAHGLNAAPEPGGTVRVLVLANLEAHKGADYLRAIKRHAGGRLELHLLGDVPERYGDLGVVHGRYRPAELRERVAAIAPALVGLFSVVAETYSHALTEAWALGVPVVATDLGAFGERLREHEGGWLVPPDDAAAAARRILAIADDPVGYRAQALRADLRGVPTAADMADGYAAVYADALAGRRSLAAPAARRALRLTAIVGGAAGEFPGSTYVRVVRPLRHPAVAGEVSARLRYADAGTVPADADAVLIQRTAVPPDRMLALLEEVAERDLPLIVDLDDHLLLSDEAAYADQRPALRALLDAAALVTVSTPALAAAVRDRCRRVALVPNAIDERLFLAGAAGPPPPAAAGPPWRLVYAGSTTHGDDLELLRPVVAELDRRAPGRYVLEVVGVQEPEADGDQRWFERLPVPAQARAYPRFVAWLRAQRDRWHVGLAPLADTEFNTCKSDLKWLEYTALGLPVVASALEPYASIADGRTGRLVGPDPLAWADAIEASLDGANAARAWSAVRDERLLAVTAADRVSVLRSVV